MRHSLSVVFGLGLALLVSACGDEGPERPSADTPAGSTIEIEVHAPASMIVTYGPRETPLRKPVVAKARFDDSGTIQDALETVEAELIAILDERKLAGVDRPVELVVSGDKDVPWRWALWIMRVASHDEVGIPKVTFRSRDDGASATVPVLDHDALVTAAGDELIEVRVKRMNSSLPEHAATRILIDGGKDAIQFPKDVTEEAPDAELDKLGSLLGELQTDGPKGVVITTASEDGWATPFTHVVRIIATSCDAGCPDVVLSERPRDAK